MVNFPTGDTGGPDGEVELDIEVAGAIALAALPNDYTNDYSSLTTVFHT